MEHPPTPFARGIFLLVILSEVLILFILRVVEGLPEKSRKHPLIKLRYALEILPPFGRLNDNYWG